MTALEQKHILVVEDDVDLCNAILKTLHQKGYRPFAAVEVREATYKLNNQAFSCILLDMRLGDGTGEELIRVIRNRKDSFNVNTPILVISGHLDGALVKQIGAQIQGALVKPFDMKTLLEAVGKLVEKS